MIRALVAVEKNTSSAADVNAGRRRIRRLKYSSTTNRRIREMRGSFYAERAVVYGARLSHHVSP